MIAMRCLVKPLAVISLFGMDAVVLAQDETPERDWPRFHLGVAVGKAQLGQDLSSAGIPENVWANRAVATGTGRKVVAGFRPLRIFGAEIQYVDFGEGDVAARAIEHGQLSPNVYMNAEANARVLSALLFIPEPSRSVDVYGKVGVADLDESFTGHWYDYVCDPFCRSLDLIFFDENHSDSRPFVGVGARFRIASAAALRIEYESIDRDEGDDTTLLSLGIAVEF